MTCLGRWECIANKIIPVSSLGPRQIYCRVGSLTTPRSSSIGGRLVLVKRNKTYSGLGLSSISYPGRLSEFGKHPPTVE